MEEPEYEKIIAQLVKFMNKLPHPKEMNDKMAEFTVDRLRLKITKLIHDLDDFASLDARGWIK
tara:strand:- start:1417 stop:1605 length:189 start_codon:yes stop_codon:yes gene_type:complete